ncbi:hypothetical protein SERLA73DRAFT_157175 [Serpula lacrymans var. lacrymans S7.3]|uniref:Uncharacterized protein n=1 Tax=Serpula lacrymans var. lacrymans (strain S7.3) TaxID=936435 RepID=F8QHT3_SERL3|nr:hypothetical protein SERLA73DRAFT_157175 [Serpula lacrymans var. lacrymans S7.3]
MSRTTRTVAPSPTPNEVVISLSTLLTVSDYRAFYPHTPITSFRPVYFALDDGSLVAPPFIHDLQSSSISLLFIGCLFTIFLRNILTSLSFITRGNVKKKALLYTLVASQLLALPSFIPRIVAQFDRSPSCALIVRIASASAGISLSLLMTAILGVKAYKCLDNARFVLLVLILIRTAATALLITDTVTMRTYRTLSGQCARQSDGYTPVFVILLFVESLFICCCFLYAVWKSRGSSAVRGRISLQLSLHEIMDRPQDIIPTKETVEHDLASIQKSRSHYTFMSEPPSRSLSLARTETRTKSFISDARSVLSTARTNLSRSRSCNTITNEETLPLPTSATRKLAPPEQAPNPQRRPSTIRISEAMERRSMHRQVRPTPQRPSSTFSRLSRYMPRMALFREVMRDELCYTTFITSTTVASVILNVVGVNCENTLSSLSWMTLTWGIISLLVMHSFGRVVRRHELEDVLQNPSAWYPVLTDRRTAEFLGHPRPHLLRSSSVSFAPHTRARRALPARYDTLTDSLSQPSQPPNFHLSRKSWSSKGGEDALSVVESISSLSASSSSSADTDARSPLDSLDSFDSYLRPPPLNQPVILPSPALDHFPTSGRNSPAHGDGGGGGGDDDEAGGGGGGGRWVPGELDLGRYWCEGGEVFEVFGPVRSDT